MRLIILALILTYVEQSLSFEGSILRAFTPGIDVLIEESLDKIETYENVEFNYTITCNKSLEMLDAQSNFSLFGHRPDSLDVMLRINDTGVANFNGYEELEIHLNCENETSETLFLTAGHLGLTNLKLQMNDVSNSSSAAVDVQLRIKRKVTLFDVLSFYILGPLILLNKCAFGAKIEIKTLVHIFTQPVALILCLILQFIAMPFFAYMYGYLFHLNEAMALALFVGATCPGGGGGYVFSYLVGGDVTLAISASLVSTLVAMGAMPATIGVYTYLRQVPNNLVIPYFKMILLLGVIAVPISTGMFINKKWPKFAEKFVKIIRPLSLFLIFCGFGFLAVTSRYIVHGPPVGWVLAVLLPTTGFVTSIVIGRCLGLSWPFSKAISLETGMKNTLLGIAVIELTYPQPEADLSSVLIIMVTLGHSSLSMLWYFCHLVKGKLCKTEEKGAAFMRLENVDSDDDGSESEMFLGTKS